MAARNRAAALRSRCAAMSSWYSRATKLRTPGGTGMSVPQWHTQLPPLPCSSAQSVHKGFEGIPGRSAPCRRLWQTPCGQSVHMQSSAPAVEVLPVRRFRRCILRGRNGGSSLDERPLPSSIVVSGGWSPASDPSCERVNDSVLTLSPSSGILRSDDRGGEPQCPRGPSSRAAVASPMSMNGIGPLGSGLRSAARLAPSIDGPSVRRGSSHVAGVEGASALNSLICSNVRVSGRDLRFGRAATGSMLSASRPSCAPSPIRGVGPRSV